MITLWYRPPELLLGEVKYGPAIDMWSAGVLFAELLLRKPILTGRNEMQQISHIFQMFGTPTDETWPGVTQLQHYKIVVESLGNAPNKFDEHFGQLDPHAKDLLRKMLAMNPSQRISAKAALDHDYFWVEPMPLKPELMPKYPSSYEYTTKKRRHEQQKQQQAQQQQQQQQQGPAPPQQHQPPHHHAQPPPHHHGQPQYGYQQQPPPQHAYPRGGPAPAYPPPAKRPAPGYEDGQYARRGAAPPNGARPQQPPPGQHASYGRPPSYGSRVRAAPHPPVPARLALSRACRDRRRPIHHTSRRRRNAGPATTATSSRGVRGRCLVPRAARTHCDPSPSVHPPPQWCGHRPALARLGQAGRARCRAPVRLRGSRPRAPRVAGAHRTCRAIHIAWPRQIRSSFGLAIVQRGGVQCVRSVRLDHVHNDVRLV